MISLILDEVKVIDMNFDVSIVFQERLASSMGLDKYRYIVEQASIINVVDTDFQRTFNGFYIVRRNESWRKSYYEYFEKYYTYTLLEFFDLSYEPIKILEREQYWKKCLDTITNGYNDN